MLASLLLMCGLFAAFLIARRPNRAHESPAELPVTPAGPQHSLAVPNSSAYALYTQGRFYWNKRSVESVQKSIDFFQQAIQAEPNYAAAYAGLADAYALAGSYGNSFLAPGVAMPKAKMAIEKALTLDDSSADAHASLAYIKLLSEWDWAGRRAAVQTGAPAQSRLCERSPLVLS